MVNVKEELVIRRPREQVARFVFDPANDLKWIGGLLSVRMLTKPPLRVGSRVLRMADFLGRSMEYILEVVALNPTRIVMESLESPFPMKVTYRLRADKQGTRAQVHVQGSPQGFYWFADPLMSLQVRLNIRSDLQRLKETLESASQ